MKTLLLILLLFVSSCSVPEKATQTAYLVAVETERNLSVKHCLNPSTVDSVAMRLFGYAMNRFDSDTLFYYSPYFRIETINTRFYAEEKEMVRKNGKVKYKKLKR